MPLHPRDGVLQRLRLVEGLVPVPDLQACAPGRLDTLPEGRPARRADHLQSLNESHTIPRPPPAGHGGNETALESAIKVPCGPPSVRSYRLHSLRPKCAESTMKPIAGERLRCLHLERALVPNPSNTKSRRNRGSDR